MAQSDNGSWMDVRLTTNDNGAEVVRVSWNLSTVVEDNDDFVLDGLTHQAVPYRDVEVVPPMLSGSGMYTDWWPTGDAMQVETGKGDDGSFERNITTRDDGGT